MSPPAEAENPGVPEGSALEPPAMSEDSSMIVHHEMGSLGSIRSSPGTDATPVIAANFDLDPNMAMPIHGFGELSFLPSPPKMPTPPPAPSLNIKAMGLAAGGKLSEYSFSNAFSYLTSSSPRYRERL